MPYFVFRINQGPTAIVKNLDLIDHFEAYKDAKALVKSQRSEQTDGDSAEIKLIFADNQLLAEEQIQQTREKPITREWEK